jgi:hypothetical protein
MSALFGLRTVINFIVKLHGFLAGEEALAQPRPLLTLHRILLLILQQKQTINQLNDIHHPDQYYMETGYGSMTKQTDEHRVNQYRYNFFFKSCYNIALHTNIYFCLKLPEVSI